MFLDEKALAEAHNHAVIVKNDCGNWTFAQIADFIEQEATNYE